MIHYYAIWKPYGLGSVNADGNRANRLYRFSDKQARENLIIDYPDKAEAIPRKAAESKLRQSPFWEFESHVAEFFFYMDRPRSDPTKVTREYLTVERLIELVGKAGRDTHVIIKVSSIGYLSLWNKLLELLTPYLKHKGGRK